MATASAMIKSGFRSLGQSRLITIFKIKELRRRAETTLGDKFDLRDFNDVVLQSGAVPLNILEARVDEWLRSK